MTDPMPIAAPDAASWLTDPTHRAWLGDQAARLVRFFRPSLRADGGFAVLDWAGRPMGDGPQELHTTTRLVHSYALAEGCGATDCAPMIAAGLRFLSEQHRDRVNGGYLWSVGPGGDATKLAYGHVFVLLAASSARIAGYDAGALFDDIAEVLLTRFWDAEQGLFRDEFTADWHPFSDYRGMNANMHGVEALLAAYEATGDATWLDRAGRILAFFVLRMAPAHGWRIPEHYTADWQVDPDYSGNPMFRPAGTTPGHSLELARLALQYWDLADRPASPLPDAARRLIYQALAEAWLPDGGLAYTLGAGGKVAITDRYWWPVCEGIAALAMLLKTDPRPEDETWYRRLWGCAASQFIDHDHGGWFPEIDAAGRPTTTQFAGKPDIYHALQALLFPLAPGLSHHQSGLAALRPLAG